MMTSGKKYQLRIDLTAPNGRKGYATYSTFSVGPPPKYTLTVNGYKGNIGNQLICNKHHIIYLHTKIINLGEKQIALFSMK